MQFEYPEGATPLDPDEIEGLIPGHIRTQAELNEWEANNINEAETWIWRKKRKPEKILASAFIKQVHKKMFEKTWRWAGEFRRSDKNIGCDWLTISQELKKLLDDVLFQMSKKSYENDEIAIRFHHRIVAIHPFSNGNGRHGRLITDYLIKSMGEERFNWGRADLRDNNENRKAYLAALRAADKGDIKPLIAFARNTK